MKKIIAKINWARLTSLLVLSVVFFAMPESAFAQAGQNQAAGDWGDLLTQAPFSTIIDVGLAGWMFYSWFQFFFDLDLSKVHKDILKPAVITILAFQWQEILTWFNIF